MSKPLNVLTVEHLILNIGKKNILNDLSFEIAAGEIHALVGPSGVGKSLTGLSIMGLLPKQAMLSENSKIYLFQKEIQDLSSKERRQLRIAHMGFIPQDPMTALNPVKTIYSQIEEVLILCGMRGRQKRRAQILNVLREVQLNEAILNHYPHQLSGGMKQRVLIAMALAKKPALLIADEPTTALDVTTQKEILELIAQLVKTHDMALLIITHDLGVVAKLNAEVLVLHEGKIIEKAPIHHLLKTPTHSSTRELLQSLPEYFPPFVHRTFNQEILQVQDLTVSVSHSRFLMPRVHKTLISEVSFSLKKGETLGIVGESGSGKTTIAKALMALLPFQGKVSLEGESLQLTSHQKRLSYYQSVQLIHQDPFASMNPKFSIRHILLEGIQRLRQLKGEAAEEKIIAALESVGLEADMLHRYPHEFSGGQCQRIAIARALLIEPKILICDEPTSGLDVLTQKKFILLLEKMKQERDLSIIFVTHNMSLVEKIADNILVLLQGKVVEAGKTTEVFASPKAPYTKRLLDSRLPVG